MPAVKCNGTLKEQLPSNLTPVYIASLKANIDLTGKYLKAAILQIFTLYKGEVPSLKIVIIDDQEDTVDVIALGQAAIDLSTCLKGDILCFMKFEVEKAPGHHKKPYIVIVDDTKDVQSLTWIESYRGRLQGCNSSGFQRLAFRGSVEDQQSSSNKYTFEQDEDKAGSPSKYQDDLEPEQSKKHAKRKSDGTVNGKAEGVLTDKRKSGGTVKESLSEFRPSVSHCANVASIHPSNVESEKSSDPDEVDDPDEVESETGYDTDEVKSESQISHSQILCVSAYDISDYEQEMRKNRNFSHRAHHGNVQDNIQDESISYTGNFKKPLSVVKESKSSIQPCCSQTSSQEMFYTAATPASHVTVTNDLNEEQISPGSMLRSAVKLTLKSPANSPVTAIVANHHIPVSTVTQVMQHEPSLKFRVQAQVQDYSPRPSDAADLVYLFCERCWTVEKLSTRLRNERLQNSLCENCKDKPTYMEPTFIMTIVLSDGHNSLLAYLYGQDAVQFFNGINPAELLSNREKFEDLKKSLASLCPSHSDLGDRPLMECCLVSYSVGQGVMYKIFDTALVQDF